MRKNATHWQSFEFPVLLVLLYVRLAGLFYMERVGPDQIRLAHGVRLL
jgi:hypothetical protein